MDTLPITEGTTVLMMKFALYWIVLANCKKVSRDGRKYLLERHLVSPNVTQRWNQQMADYRAKNIITRYRSGLLLNFHEVCG